MKIIIAGGGIGGLTAALCLIRAGHTVIVLEQAEELREVGAGLQISPNSARVFAALGILKDLEAVAFKPQALEMRLGQTGRTIFSLPIGPQQEARWCAPYLHIHRAHLLGVLAARLMLLDPDALKVAARVTAIDTSGQGVKVTLGSGAVHEGDVLIGADGIHSVVRTHMLGPDRARFTGNVAWRAVVPVDRLGRHAPPPTACVWVGPGRHAVTYRLDGGRLANFVGVVETDVEPDESWRARGTRAQALTHFACFAVPVRSLIEQADDLFLWALRDRAPLACWHDGPVALLGDAAHPMLPFLAQGASMAIEDAWVLAGCLKQASDASGLARYEAIRKPRATRVQAASADNMAVFHRRSRLAQIATYGPAWVAGRIAPGVLRGMQDWIYTHDVLADVAPY